MTVVNTITTWIVVGAAYRIVNAAPDQGPGGVTPDEAFMLMATERGRHARGCAAMIVRACEGIRIVYKKLPKEMP